MNEYLGVDDLANMTVDDLAALVNNATLAQYSDIAKSGAKLGFSWESFVGPRRTGHTVVTPKTAGWLAERAAFVERWAAIQDEGLQKGFLGYGECYECGGAVEGTTNTEDHKYIFDEEDAA